MGVRVYELADRLGMESRQLLAKARELGIAGADDPTSSISTAVAEYLERELRRRTVALATPETPSKTGTAQLMPLRLRPPIVVSDLATRLNRKGVQVIADLMELGVFVTLNQTIDLATAQRIAAPYGFKLETESDSSGGDELSPVYHSLNELRRTCDEMRAENESLRAVVTDLGRRLTENDRPAVKALPPEPAEPVVPKRVEPPKPARLVVVDGLNVMNYRRSPTDTKPLDLTVLLTVLAALKRRGDEFVCIFDAKTYPILERHKREQLAAFQKLLQRYASHFAIVFGGVEADYFILSLADAREALVLSNDKFLDYRERFPWVMERQYATAGGRPGFRHQRLVRGGIIGNTVCAPELDINEPLNRNLDQLLTEFEKLLGSAETAAPDIGLP